MSDDTLTADRPSSRTERASLENRLAFTTLGIPGAPLAEVAALAGRTGWRGVELRSAPDEPIHIGLTRGERSRAVAELGDTVIVATNSYVRAGAEGPDEPVVEAMLAEAALAADLGALAVRVFPGVDSADLPDAEHAMVRRLRTAAERLPGGLALWLETHDSHRSGRSIARVLDAVDHERVKAIWDVAHPPKEGEEWSTTLQALQPWLAHVQIKDELPGQVPLFLGAGDVPLIPVINALVDDGYAGWFSLEYEKKWHPEAPPLEDALTNGLRWWREQHF